MARDEPREDTSIRIKVETWRRLKDRKNQPNESFDDIISDLLDIAEDIEEDPSSASTTR